MAIEFTCPQCDHLLRTAEDKAGLSAKCPACGEAIWVPYPHEAEGRSASGEDDRDDVSLEKEDVFEVEENAQRESSAQDLPPPPFPPVDPPKTDEIASDWSRPEAEGEEAVEPPPRRRQPAGEEIICPNCQASNGPAASNCRICGESLEGVEPVIGPSWSPPVPDVGETWSTTWRIYQDRMGLLIGGMLLVQALYAAMLVAVYFVFIAITFGAGGGGDEMILIGMIVGGLIAFVGGSVVVAFAEIGTTRFLLNIAKGRPAEIGDLFYGFGEGRRLLPLMLLLSPVVLILHLFINGLGWLFFWPFVWHYVDRQQSVGETFRSFFELLGKQLGFVVLIGLIAWAINLAVAFLIYPCCIGLIVTVFSRPFVSLLHAVGYLRLSEQKTALDELL